MSKPIRPEIDADTVKLLNEAMVREGFAGKITLFIRQVLRDRCLGKVPPLAYGRVLLDRDVSGSRPTGKRTPRDHR